MVSQKCLARRKVQLKTEVPNFSSTSTTVLFRSPFEKKKKISLGNKRLQFLLLLLLANTQKKKSEKRKTFTAFPLLVLGKHNKATAGRHLFFSSYLIIELIGKWKAYNPFSAASCPLLSL